MKVKIIIHTDLTEAMQNAGQVATALRQLATDLHSSGALFTGKRLAIYAPDETEVGHLKVKEF